jgi:drug/metabolite transporter (DMT)-like permease
MNPLTILNIIFVIIPGIISFFVMRKEKAAVPEGQVDESPLSGNTFWYVFILCLLAPLIAQAIFYHGWKKRLPNKAKKANNLGWLAILLWIGVYIAINTLLR